LLLGRVTAVVNHITIQIRKLHVISGRMHPKGNNVGPTMLLEPNGRQHRRPGDAGGGLAAWWVALLVAHDAGDE
jgi:hypothetical protein